MAFTCINPIGLYQTVMVYLTNQADCGQNLAVFTPAELVAYNASILAGGGGTAPGVVSGSGFPVLSLLEAQQIGSSIALIWGLGFTIRAVAVLLKSSSGDSND